MEDAEKKRALKEFRSGIGQKGLRGTYLAVNLHNIILDWFAQPDRRERFLIDARPPHEIVALVEYVETALRSKWQVKANKTRATNKDRQHKKEEAARQLSLGFK